MVSCLGRSYWIFNRINLEYARKYKLKKIFNFSNTYAKLPKNFYEEIKPIPVKNPKLLNSMCLEGRKNAEELFDIKKVVDTHIKTYQFLLDQKN